MNEQKSARGGGIAIGVIGPSILVQRTEEALKSFPSFIPFLRTCRSREEAATQAEELMRDVEVLLFCEYHLYIGAKERVSFTVPVHTVPLMGTGLYRSLFRLKSLFGLKSLSIDSVSENYVEQMLGELGERPEEIRFFSGPSHAGEKEILRFHQESRRNRGETVVLTGIRPVAEVLDHAGIPHEWVTPTHQDLIVALERALLSTQTRRNKEAQIVVGVIQIDGYRGSLDSFSSQHEAQRLELDLHRTILDYVQQLDGHLTNLGGGEYLFFTTRGIFERETRGYKFIPLLQDTKRSTGHSLSIGIGFGRSATDAGSHARLALRQSKESGGNICFIVREDRSVIGPVAMTPPVIYDLSVTDARLLEEAEKAGMSATYIGKLIAQINRYDKIDYTAHELASVLGITVRSAHRILVQWLDAELVEIIGEEKISTKGRPRQIYRLTFVRDQMWRQAVPAREGKIRK
ncbi:hypothetical protein ACFQ49_12860 [Kroppenstedtia eburnea]|uniref:hypothetical protein n=1 Tax=Kroppenstedtia eburnea TaxID=714067 RepID=UPI00364586E8